MGAPERITAGRPIHIVKIVSQYLAAGEAGRHKLYAAVLHPLKLRLAFAATKVGLPVPNLEMLSEPDFWDLVGRRAVEAATTETEAFLSLTNQQLDITRQPPHPFLMATPVQETTCC